MYTPLTVVVEVYEVIVKGAVYMNPLLVQLETVSVTVGKVFVVVLTVEVGTTLVAVLELRVDVTAFWAIKLVVNVVEIDCDVVTEAIEASVFTKLVVVVVFVVVVEKLIVVELVVSVIVEGTIEVVVLTSIRVLVVRVDIEILIDTEVIVSILVEEVVIVVVEEEQLGVTVLTTVNKYNVLNPKFCVCCISVCREVVSEVQEVVAEFSQGFVMSSGWEHTPKHSQNSVPSGQTRWFVTSSVLV